MSTVAWPVSCRRAATPPMTTNSTPWSASLRQIATTWSSSSSGGIAGKPVPLGPKPGADFVGQRAFPGREDVVVVVAVRKLDTQLQPRLRQQPEQSRQGRLPTPRLV